DRAAHRARERPRHRPQEAPEIDPPLARERQHGAGGAEARLQLVGGDGLHRRDAGGHQRGDGDQPAAAGECVDGAGDERGQRQQGENLETQLHRTASCTAGTRTMPSWPARNPRGGASRARRKTTRGRTSRPRSGVEAVRPYQTTSAIEQFSPEPMPSSAIRLPFFRRPSSRSFDSTIGTEAGPMLPCSPKMVMTFFGSMPMALVKAAVCTLLTWWMTNSSNSAATQPSFCLATSK